VNDRDKFFRMEGAEAWTRGRDLPILTEWDEASGAAGPYFLQDQTVARWILESQPRRHVDVGSRLDGFVGNLSVFRKVEVIDIRPHPGTIRNITFHRMDLTAELPETWIESTDSLSCLHTIEHLGLGRYGDAIDPMGHLAGLTQLKRMLEPGGVLYLSTPIGPQRIEFNAHRVFAASTLIGWFANGWAIERFALIDDQNILREDVDWCGPDITTHFGCELGIGIVAARRIV
jgi:hypothetical protein